jgi:hypothetical protein
VGFFEDQSNKAYSRRQCPAFWQQDRSGLSRFFIQVGEHLLDDHQVLTVGDHFDGATAFPARFDVDIDKSAGEPICTATGCSP